MYWSYSLISVTFYRGAGAVNISYNDNISLPLMFVRLRKEFGTANKGKLCNLGKNRILCVKQVFSTVQTRTCSSNLKEKALLYFHKINVP
jgi:hypothetical protein